MKVRDVMTSDVKVIKQDDTVREFLARLEDLNISGMPVVDNDGRLLGVATMTDVGKGVQDPPLTTESDRDFYDEDEGNLSSLETAKVADIMTEHIMTVKPETDLYELANLMSESGIHRVFVTSGEKVVGVVTSLDMVRVLGEMLASQMAGAG